MKHGRPRPPSRPHASPVVRAAGRSAREIEHVFGVRAAMAVVATAPARVMRVLASRDLPTATVEQIRRARGLDATVNIVSGAELARACGSDLHEGLCLETAPREWTTAAALIDHLARTRGTCVALDRVRNPYNIGAIIRSAAFFGVDAVLLGAQAPHPALAPLAVRVAEGGTEHVRLARTTDLADTLSKLRLKGVHVYAGESGSSKSALGFAFARPAVLVMGNEREGLSERILRHCDETVTIPGGGSSTGDVGSLNVSVAASVLIAELRRPDLT